MNLLEAIKERRSVRSYDGNRLTDLQIATLLDAINESSSPFGGRLTIRLKEFDLRKGYRPTTYGMIKGARHFFLLASAPTESQRSAPDSGSNRSCSKHGRWVWARAGSPPHSKALTSTGIRHGPKAKRSA